MVLALIDTVLSRPRKRDKCTEKAIKIFGLKDMPGFGNPINITLFLYSNSEYFDGFKELIIA